MACNSQRDRGGHVMAIGVVPEAPPPDPLAVESLVAAIGIEPFFAGTLRKVHGHHLQRAAGMPDEIARRIHRFLARAEKEPTAELPPFDFMEVQAMIDADADRERAGDTGRTVQEMAAFGEDHDTAVQASLVVQRIKAAVRAKLPRRVRNTLTGPVNEMPGHSEVARFRRLWVVACDPLSVLDDLNEFALSRDQIEVCATLYPLVWGEFWPTAQQQLARRKVQQPKFELGHRKDQLLRVLTRQEAPNVPLGRALQAIYAAKAQAEQQAQAQPSKAKAGASDELAASDRVDVPG